MNKALKVFLIVLLSIAVFVLLCVGIYSIGFLDGLLVFLLIPGLMIASLLCFVVNLIPVIRAKREHQPISQKRKMILVISGTVFGCILISVIALALVFAAAIAFM